MARKLIVEIVGDSRSYERAMGRSERATKDFGRVVGGTTQKVTAGFGAFVKGAVIFQGVDAAFRAVGSAVRAGASEFSQMQQVQAGTQAVLKSTGGVAKVTAEDVTTLATRLSRLSGVDDEAIQSAENLILTFKNVRNEIGQGNQIFDRAALAALDMSKVAGGAFGDLPTTSKQLAKALNDPVRGMTALSRAGVTFSDSQKDAIKQMVASNNLLGAQKLVLREVESQVEGQAKAFGETLPGQLAKVREAFRNVFGNLAAVVAEPLAAALGAVAGFIPKIEAGVSRFSAAVSPIFGNIVVAAREVLPGVLRIIQSVFGPIRQYVEPIIRDVANIIRTTFSNIVQVFDDNRQELTTIFTNLGTIIKSLWTIARPTVVFLFQTALPAALRVVIPIIEKVTGLYKVMAEIFATAVSIILKAIDKLLGAFSGLAGAFTWLPGVGDDFKNTQTKVDATRESIRGFAGELDALDGKSVKVDVEYAVRVTGDFIPGDVHTPSGTAGTGKTKTKTETVVQTAADGNAVIAQITRQAAAATAGLNRQLRDSEIRAAHLKDLIRADPTNLKLQQRLNAELQKQHGIRTQIADQERQSVENAREAAKQAREERLEREKAARERQRTAVQANLFKALGLTAEGEKPTPGSGALIKRAQSMLDSLKLTKKTRAQLKTIVAVLKANFKQAGQEVRAAILDMLNTISGAGKDKQGPLTKGSGLNTNKILEGMGLSPEEERELRHRLANVSSAGKVLAKAGAAKTRTTRDGVGFGNNPAVLVESHTTINLDGKQIANAITKQQQKDRRRNPGQKRGPQARIGGV